MAFDYCTVADAFAYGGTSGAATDPVNEAAVMAQVVTAVSRAIDHDCEQAFSIETYTDQKLRAVVDGDGVLTCYPGVPTMQQPTAAAYRVGNSLTWFPLTASELDIESAPHGSTVRALGADYSAYRFQRVQVQLSYIGGYADTAALPRDLAWCAQALAWLTYQRRSAPMDSTAMPELGIVINPGVWPADVRRVLNRYKKVVGA